MTQNISETTPPLLKLNINSMTVIGRISERCAGKLCVEILSPYYGYTRVHQVSFFSRIPHSYLSEFGDIQALNFLRDLYNDCCQLEKELALRGDAIQLAYDTLQTTIAAIPPIDKEFSQVRHMLHTKLNNGSMTQKDYQQALKDARKAQTIREQHIASLKTDFAKQLHLPELSCFTKQQVLAILSRQLPLRRSC